MRTPWIVALLFLGGCSFRPLVNGSGRLETKSYPLPVFSATAVEISDTFRADIVRGESFTVAITADDNLFEYITVSQERAKLTVELEDISLGSGTLEATITMPLLDELDVHGNVLRRVDLDVHIRYLYPSEAHTLVESAGLAVSRACGTFDRSPLAEHSEEMIFLCHPAS